MRLIRITTNYPAYLDDFYARHPALAEAPYSAQYGAFMQDGYGWAGHWTRAFGNLGYEVWEPVGNAEPMQKAWARENDVGFAEGTWRDDILTEQAKRFRPDVAFVNDYSTYGPSFIERLRRACPSVRLVVGWCGAPFSDGRVFRSYDLVLSNIPALVAHFRSGGRRSEHLRHAFDASILERIGVPADPPTAFSFIGSIVKRPGFHGARERLLKTLVRETGLEIWADIRRPSPGERRSVRRAQWKYDAVRAAVSAPGLKPFLANIPRVRNYAAMERRPDLSHYVDEEIAARARPALFGLAMYRALAGSRVTLNTHIDIAADSASNMRLFEATGVGACLLTEGQQDLREVFEPDVEVATYRDPEEAVEKVRYLLAHEETRRAIAAAGQRRTLRDHTFDRRAQQIDRWIRDRLQ